MRRIAYVRVEIDGNSVEVQKATEKQIIRLIDRYLKEKTCAGIGFKRMAGNENKD